MPESFWRGFRFDGGNSNGWQHRTANLLLWIFFSLPPPPVIMAEWTTVEGFSCCTIGIRVRCWIYRRSTLPQRASSHPAFRNTTRTRQRHLRPALLLCCCSPPRTSFRRRREYRRNERFFLTSIFFFSNTPCSIIKFVFPRRTRTNFARTPIWRPRKNRTTTACSHLHGHVS